MNDRMLKKIGMTLFILSVGLFVGLSIFIPTSFKNKDLSGVIEAKHEGLANSVSKLEDAPPFRMDGKISDALYDYNQYVVSQKGIGEKTQASFLKALNNETSNFDESYINGQLGKGTYNAEKLIEYTGWMVGKEWENFMAFEVELKKKFSEVNKAVTGEYGIASGKQGQLTLDLMIAGAPANAKTGLWAFVIFGLAVLGGFIHFIPLWRKKPGIHNNHIQHNKGQNRQWPAWIVLALLVGFYIFLYQYPTFLSNQIALLMPLSFSMSGGAANQWFLYGFMYCVAMTVMGLRMLIKYRGNAYEQVRTCSVIFFQLAFAFTIPQILTKLQLPAYDLKSAWPLEYSFFFDYRVDQYLAEGTLGIFLFGWGIALFAIGVPLFTYLYGKRWYCSWVCGCGGLAETVGDPYRHLSDKSKSAWKVERWTVHGVLAFAVVMTLLVVYTTFSGESEVLGLNSYSVRSSYGFFIGFIFAGAVGTGFYPIMGNRVWCRFGCPLAAYLGLVQRFKSRFRITTNGGQCISCGNCSTYCEMGIDVRWYAQRGQNIVRSSCVGCGVCSAVCPRGVLKLENKSEERAYQ